MIPSTASPLIRLAYTAQLGNGTDITTFSFTTAGAPASMSLTLASQTVLVGESADLAESVKDASGNLTQIANGDSITLASNTSDTVSTSSLVATDMFLGAADITLDTAGNPAGTTTVTALPAGTLPSLGLTAQTATVTKSGTVSSAAVVNMTVSSPATAVNVPASGRSISRTSQVPQRTSSITVAVDDTSANAAGTKLPFGVNLSPVSGVISAGATVNGELVTSLDDTVYVLVDTDASMKANVAVTVGGGATNAGAVITVFQAKVDGTAATGHAKITISQLAPTLRARTSPSAQTTPSSPSLAKRCP